jgi:penicillin-binding protein 1A
MASLLKDVVNAGTGIRAKIEGRFVAGKTGTTNEEHDAWFVGFTPHLSTAVYVGFDQLAPLGRLEAGGRTAAPVFHYYRSVIENQYPAEDYAAPEGVIFTAVDGMYLPFKTGEPLYGTVAPQTGENNPSQVAEDIFKQVF